MNAAAAATKKPAAEKVNKSDIIRKILAKGIDKPSDVVAEAFKDGHTIDKGLVSQIKAKIKADGGGGTSSGRSKSSGGEPSWKSVLAVLKEAGGVAEISKALKTLEGAKEAQTLITKLGGESAAKELAELLKAAK